MSAGELAGGSLQQGSRGQHEPLAGVALAGQPLDADVLVAAQELDDGPDGVNGWIAELDLVTDLKTGVARS